MQQRSLFRALAAAATSGSASAVEDQQRADERIPELLATPAAVRFLSCEPLLGPPCRPEGHRAAGICAGRDWHHEADQFVTAGKPSSIG
jgi:hypothetical protein